MYLEGLVQRISLYRASIIFLDIVKKERSTHPYGWGKLRKIGLSVISIMVACESLLNMAPICILSYSWVICLSYSRTNVTSHFTSSTPSKKFLS